MSNNSLQKDLAISAFLYGTFTGIYLLYGVFLGNASPLEVSLALALTGISFALLHSAPAIHQFTGLTYGSFIKVMVHAVFPITSYIAALVQHTDLASQVYSVLALCAPIIQFSLLNNKPTPKFLCSSLILGNLLAIYLQSQNSLLFLSVQAYCGILSLLFKQATFVSTFECLVQTESEAPHIHDCIYKQFFLNVPQAEFIIDLNPNPALARPSILNLTAEATVKASVDRFFDSAYLENTNQTLSEYIKSRRRTVGPCALKWDKVQVEEDEEEDVFEVSAMIFEDEKEGRKLGVILFEPPKYKRKEKELLKHFKTSLICSLSHELCTPMNSLMPLLKMMPGCLTKDKNEDLKEIAVSSAELLYSKIRDLVDYNKIEMGEFKMEDSEFVLADLFQELEQIFRFEVLHKSNLLKFKVNAMKDRQLMLYADRARIKQVLVKLIFNANKYTSKGSIVITANEIEKNLDVEFIVQDTGIGMTQTTLEFIFSSLHEKAKFLYRQQNESTKLPGLGLGIAKSICEALGGILKVKSEEGKGTTFSFTLPTCRIFSMADNEAQEVLRSSSLLSRGSFHRMNSLKEKKKGCRIFNSTNTSSRNLVQPLKSSGRKSVASTKNIARSVEKIPIPNPQKDSKFKVPLNIGSDFQEETTKPILQFSSGFLNPVSLQKTKCEMVLIVDDVYGNRVVLREMLKKQGIPTLEAGDGSEALELVRSTFAFDSTREIKLIFMDLNMPIMDGIQATAAIRELETTLKPCRKIPIVAVTANNNEEDKAKCFTAGMQDYIAKPVTFRRLMEAVQRYIQ